MKVNTAEWKAVEEELWQLVAPQLKKHSRAVILSEAKDLF